MVADKLYIMCSMTDIQEGLRVATGHLPEGFYKEVIRTATAERDGAKREAEKMILRAATALRDIYTAEHQLNVARNIINAMYR